MRLRERVLFVILASAAWAALGAGEREVPAAAPAMLDRHWREQGEQAQRGGLLSADRLEAAWPGSTEAKGFLRLLGCDSGAAAGIRITQNPDNLNEFFVAGDRLALPVEGRAFISRLLNAAGVPIRGVGPQALLARALSPDSTATGRRGELLDNVRVQFVVTLEPDMTAGRVSNTRVDARQSSSVDGHRLSYFVTPIITLHPDATVVQAAPAN